VRRSSNTQVGTRNGRESEFGVERRVTTHSRAPQGNKSGVEGPTHPFNSIRDKNTVLPKNTQSLRPLANGSSL
jgi:hypothetical protein